MSAEKVPTVNIISYASVHDKVLQDRASEQPNSFRNNQKQGIVGLTNIGNTCYLNTALQCLANTPALSEYFLGFPWQSELNPGNPLGSGGKIAEAYGKLITDINNQKNTIITPTSIKKSLGRFQSQFNNNRQQDVQELLALLLDGLHEDLNRVLDKPYVADVESGMPERKEAEVAVESWRVYLLRNRSIVVDIFQGQLRNVLQCLSCSHKSLKFDPYMYMSLPCNNQTTTLRDCLTEFCQPEVLSAGCQWHCPNCKQLRDAEKKLDLWIAPPIFIVHLKRFMNTNGKRSKINSLIDFPVTGLNLSDFIGNKTGSRTHLYNLYGVANHHGSLSRGHYTAFARNQRTGKWYNFNDTKIHEIKESNIITESAYVLFYSKVCKTETEGDAIRGVERQQGTEVVSVEERMGSWPVFPDEQPQPTVQMLTVDMIRRQSITIPHLWPHNVTSTSTSMPYAAAPLDSFGEGQEEEEEEEEEEKEEETAGEGDDDAKFFANIPRPSFYSASPPCTDQISSFISENVSNSKEDSSSTKADTASCCSNSSAPDLEGKKKRKYARKVHPVNNNYVDRRRRPRGAPERYGV